MLQNIDLIARGETLPLPLTNSLNSEFQVVDITGLGPVKADLSTFNKGDDLGVSVLGSTKAARNIVISFRLNPKYNLGYDVEYLRALLYEYIIPGQQISLQFTNDQLYEVVKADGWVESIEPELFTKEPQVAVSILCPDPYFRSVNEGTYSTNINTSANAITEPFNIWGVTNTGFRVVIQKQSAGAAYTGTIDFWTQYPDNATKMSIASVTIGDDHELHISTEPGNRYIKRKVKSTGVWTNMLNLLPAAPIWPTLLSAPPNYVGSGPNAWRIHAQSAGAITSTIFWRSRYGGL